MIYYPAFLDLKEKQALLFGAGEVAFRKAKVLIQAGAKVSVISRDFSSDFIRLAKQKKIKLTRGSKIPKQLKNISLIIAATSDSTFNKSIYKRCKKSGILVNVVDDPDHSTFIVPSVIRRGNLQVAISTGGASPYLAKLLRQKFEAELSSKYADLVRFFKKERIRIKAGISNSNQRREYFYRLVKSKLNQLNQKRK